MFALTSLVCIAWKFWLEWNARNGTGFSCLTFHWRMHRVFFPRKVNQWKRKGGVSNEHDLKFFVIFCCCFAKILLVFGHFFFLFVNLSRIFHSFRTFFGQKLLDNWHTSAENVEIREKKIRRNTSESCHLFRKLSHGLSCTIRISYRNFRFPLTHGKRCRPQLLFAHDWFEVFLWNLGRGLAEVAQRFAGE